MKYTWTFNRRHNTNRSFFSVQFFPGWPVKQTHFMQILSLPEFNPFLSFNLDVVVVAVLILLLFFFWVAIVLKRTEIDFSLLCVGSMLCECVCVCVCSGRKKRRKLLTFHLRSTSMMKCVLDCFFRSNIQFRICMPHDGRTWTRKVSRTQNKWACWGPEIGGRGLEEFQNRTKQQKWKMRNESSKSGICGGWAKCRGRPKGRKGEKKTFRKKSKIVLKLKTFTTLSLC